MERIVGQCLKCGDPIEAGKPCASNGTDFACQVCYSTRWETGMVHERGPWLWYPGGPDQVDEIMKP